MWQIRMQREIQKARDYGRISNAQYSAACMEFWRLWKAAGMPDGESA